MKLKLFTILLVVFVPGYGFAQESKDYIARPKNRIKNDTLFGKNSGKKIILDPTHVQSSIYEPLAEKSTWRTDTYFPIPATAPQAGKGVTIQNSLPKGGPYIDPNGNKFGYTMFWTRVINETDTPFELTISFPEAILPSPDDYLKLFLPPDTMTIDKVLLYDYGATGVKSFLDTGINQPTMVQRTINPNQEIFFYVGALFHHANGVSRAELVLKGQELFYKISGIAPELDSSLIPCGRIVFKK